MRALQLIGDRKLELVELADPAPPADGEVQIRIKAVGLNHSTSGAMAWRSPSASCR